MTPFKQAQPGSGRPSRQSTQKGVYLSDDVQRPTLEPEAIHCYNASPYFTYEVGVDEPPHPDNDVAARFVEVAVSHCKYGCKIYADPYSEIRILVHSMIYGCRRTVSEINVREPGEVRVGDTVSFASLSDPLIKHTGRVLNYIPPDEAGFQGGFYVGCYYVVPKSHISEQSNGETYQQAYQRLTQEGIFHEEDIASYFGITIERLRQLQLWTDEDLIFDGTEFQVGDLVSFRDFEDPDVKHLGTISRYIPPDYAPEDHPHGGYGVTYRDQGRFRHILFYQKSKLKKEQ